MAAEPKPTNAYLARYYKFKRIRSFNPFAKPKAEVSKSTLCVVYGMEIVDLQYVACKIAFMNNKVKYFDPKRLDHAYVERKGGYHLQMIGSINYDGSVTACEEPITTSLDVFVMAGVLMNTTRSAIQPFLSNPVWVAEQRFPPSPLELKYGLLD
ncbi:MAG: hypothetical protein ACOVQN_04400 [Exiguobacterium sp.]|jgi:hypothetical protein